MKCGNKFIEEKPKYVKLKKANRIELITSFPIDKIKKMFINLRNKTLLRDFTLVPNYIMTGPMASLSIDYEGKTSKEEISKNLQNIDNLASLQLTFYIHDFFPNSIDISLIESLQESSINNLKYLAIDFDHHILNYDQIGKEKVYLNLKLYEVFSKFNTLTSLSIDLSYMDCNFSLINSLSKTIKSLVNLQNLELDLFYDYEEPIYWDLNLVNLFDAFSFLTKLRSLKLAIDVREELEESFNVGDKLMIYFASKLKSCIMLQKLDLTFHYISIGSISALAKCFKKLPELKIMKLTSDESDLSDPDGDFFNELIDSLENVQEFYLDIKENKSFIEINLWEFKKFKKLEKLSIITEIDDYTEDELTEILEKIKELPKLKSLELDRRYDEDLLRLFRKLNISDLFRNTRRSNTN